MSTDHDPDRPERDQRDEQHDEQHDDLRARLAAADPAATLPAADQAEADALLRRVVDSDLRATGTHGRSRLTWLVAAAAVVVIAVGGTVWLRQSEDGTAGDPDSGLVAQPSGTPSRPTGTTLSVGTAAARCMVPTRELLAGKELAFAGTVLGVTDGVATIRPTTVYAGDVDGEVTLTGAVAPDTGPAVEGDPELVAGRDYLIASDGTTVAGCGLSGPADPALQRLYDEAFGR